MARGWPRGPGHALARIAAGYAPGAVRWWWWPGAAGEMGKGQKGANPKASGYMDAGGDEASERPSPLLRGLNVVSFAAALATNGFAGGRIGTISRKYDNDIVPDGWAFSIWGIIYTLLFGFVI